MTSDMSDISEKRMFVSRAIWLHAYAVYWPVAAVFPTDLNVRALDIAIGLSIVMKVGARYPQMPDAELKTAFLQLMASTWGLEVGTRF